MTETIRKTNLTNAVRVETSTFAGDRDQTGIVLRQDEDVICLTSKQAKTLIFAIIDALPAKEKRGK